MNSRIGELYKQADEKTKDKLLRYFSLVRANRAVDKAREHFMESPYPNEPEQVAIFVEVSLLLDGEESKL
jgi:hypothetical protein